MRYLTTLILLSGLAVSAPAAMAQQAQTAPPTSPAPQANPYQTTVAVPDTAAASRDHAFAVALYRVLERVSGHTPDAALLSGASTYVQQYQYARAPAGSAEPFRVTVSFAPAAIQHLERRMLAPPVAAVTEPAGTSSTAMAPVVPVSTADASVWVSGVDSALDFAQVLAALRELPGVDAVAVRKAHGDGVLLDVKSSVSLNEVLAGLGRSGHFAAALQAHAGAAVSLHWTQ